MRYFNLKDTGFTVSFKEATIQGQANDKGLFFPEAIPSLPASFFQQIEHYSREEIAFTVLQPYVSGDIPDSELKEIITDTINFPIPLVPVQENIYSLELFHGPTLAFKDVGARFMSRCLGYFVRNLNKKVTVLVATSGDTGGAVANGFYGVDGVNVVILYPSGKVSSVQELQLTTLGNNITALEVEGNFDDCQQLVKQAFTDKALKEQLFLTSANSINVARWLPQQVYYFLAWQQWPFKDQPPVISVPSGNFGNICAGLLAHKSGLPAHVFLAACNTNDVVPNYLETGRYEPRKAKATLSNAMDVGDPSNFVRVLQLFDQNFLSLKEHLQAESITDEETVATIEKVYKQHQYILDPHGAVGYAALEHYLARNPGGKGYFLETAHPIKFYETIEPAIGQPIDRGIVNALMDKEKECVRIRNNYHDLQAYLLELAG
jgi:threonine synthase